ncbi:hypothetical protein CBR_g36650 [Chara braunii]|uniref:Uncharacterized protein n=1 Tax=Chara braunii TaxID=69332 RepID=A0A388LLE4_CHABU|nr:hypothetical protein CBR_g36650 [Chara braunii]|eukprot:GBG83032.1 hypothetical protein CBR_g36650 [Chara braunii]
MCAAILLNPVAAVRWAIAESSSSWGARRNSVIVRRRAARALHVLLSESRLHTGSAHVVGIANYEANCRVRWSGLPLLCCAVLCCAVLCCAVLCCAVPWDETCSSSRRGEAGQNLRGHRDNNYVEHRSTHWHRSTHCAAVWVGSYEDKGEPTRY